MPDTNVIISALLWPDSKPARALVHAALYHELMLCAHIVQEVREVVRRKWPTVSKKETLIRDGSLLRNRKRCGPTHIVMYRTNW